MTERLYYTSPYLKEIDAVVTAVEGNGFLLDRTIFYPECGGQRGDSGFFGEYRIITTIQSSSGEPLHIVEGSLPSIGERLTLVLDWDERFFGMKEHTAQHLLSSVLFASYSIGTVAVHHGRDEITIETDRKEISSDVLLSVEEKAIALIGENRRVWTEEKERREVEKMNLRRSIKVDGGSVRVVFIEGQDAVPCGGVHLRSLSEIGELMYTGSETIRGHVRTSWRIAGKAGALRRENQSLVNRAKALLSSDSSSLIPDIEKLIEENRNLKRENRDLRGKEAVREFEEKKGNVVVYSTRAELDLLIKAATLDSSRRVFITGGGRTFLFAGTVEEFGLLKNKLSLRGGGRERLFRGTYTLDESLTLSSAEEILCSLQN